MRSAAWAQSPAAVSSVPIGTALTIVSDETVDPRVRPGSEFRAHLRDPLVLGSTLVATAGTPARVIVTAKDTERDGTTHYHIAIGGLNLGLAGTLPVKPDTPVVSRIAAGIPIPVTSLAAIGYEAGRIRVEIPLPFKLSNEPPNGGYTPAPLRTASPIVPRRKPTPKPAPSVSASASPDAAASASPDASAVPAASPSAAASGSPSAAPSTMP